jgi:hypothetical protein
VREHWDPNPALYMVVAATSGQRDFLKPKPESAYG